MAALAAGGCREPVQPPAEPKAERVMRGCEEASRLLEQVKAGAPGFDYDDEGNGRVPAELWEQLPPPMRDGLVKAMAYRAICESGEISDREVTIRSSESGDVIVREVVTDFAR